MPALMHRRWVPAACEALVQAIAAEAAGATVKALDAEIDRLAQGNRAIHERDCINLNPAGNAMNPRAERLLAAGLGSRPSLGYPGDKYEMGLEAVERIEVIAAELAAETFGAKYAEIRVAAGSMANLYAFMATCAPGDAIIAPPALIGGHVTHHAPGAAGLFGLKINAAPVDAGNYTVDVDALRVQATKLRPKLITIGGSLNLFAHPVRELRAIADEVGARLLFDGAHLAGLIAGGAWPNPLAEGAHLLTMSTYKSLGGPPSGLVLTNDEDLAQRLDAIAFPGLTANFDAAKAASLAMSLLDWKLYGEAYAAAMVDTARALAQRLADEGLPVYAADRGATTSHQFALETARFGGGQAMAKRLRRANILASGIGLPLAPVEGDMNGLRLGTPEIVRWGLGPAQMGNVARFIRRALANDAAAQALAAEVAEYRRAFSKLQFVR
jgi:glycine hydroxymethyltransferase